MGYIVDNAIIMAAGAASRFAPISNEKPKGLIEVRGEVLIERQIKQLKDAGIDEIVVVVGFAKEQFEYLVNKFDVIIIENSEYLYRNNHSSLYVAKDYLKNTYICSSDNYFVYNPFEREVDESYYAGVYANTFTNEWCMYEDENGYIRNVVVGGEKAWYMLGHAFFSEDFSRKFVDILEREYGKDETKDKYWENLYIDNIDQLKMKIRKYSDDYIFEFDTLDELRLFDKKYVNNSGSKIMQKLANELGCQESDIVNLIAVKGLSSEAIGFEFDAMDNHYIYEYESCCVRRVNCG